MKNYMKNYVKEVEEKLDTRKFKDNDFLILKDKINYFQHERLIHLLVTLFYALSMFILLYISLLKPIVLIPFFIVLIFLIFYVIHYFYLENIVQYMYILYDRSNGLRK
ncbi:MAG: hypothetical protein NC181_04260 [Clostridium sp.]|nr:hypothetical protein [Clostridium sp.]MCM1444441.1 hypothetical protein [Candidatus Amulumruptor caecigallinarius]